MKKVKVEEVKSGNAVMQTFGGLLIAVGILDFALSWGGTNITAFLGPLSHSLLQWLSVLLGLCNA